MGWGSIWVLNGIGVGRSRDKRGKWALSVCVCGGGGVCLVRREESLGAVVCRVL